MSREQGELPDITNFAEDRTKLKLALRRLSDMLAPGRSILLFELRRRVGGFDTPALANILDTLCPQAESNVDWSRSVGSGGRCNMCDRMDRHPTPDHRVESNLVEVHPLSVTYLLVKSRPKIEIFDSIISGS
jgi:hypothetical protein